MVSKETKYVDPFKHINEPHTQKLKDLGLIIDQNGILHEDEDIANDDMDQVDSVPVGQTDSEDDGTEIPNINNDYPGVDYALQSEIIRFFSTNPAPEPSLFREFATSMGLEPDDLQFQANILLTQLIDIYLKDAEELGYGDALTTDKEIDPEIVKMVTAED